MQDLYKKEYYTLITLTLGNLSISEGTLYDLPSSWSPPLSQLCILLPLPLLPQRLLALQQFPHLFWPWLVLLTTSLLPKNWKNPQYLHELCKSFLPSDIAFEKVMGEFHRSYFHGSWYHSVIINCVFSPNVYVLWQLSYALNEWKYISSMISPTPNNVITLKNGVTTPPPSPENQCGKY